MKKQTACLLLSLFTALLCVATALADMGPKDQLTVKVKNAPDCLYYLDILEVGPKRKYENLTKKERAALNGALLSALEAAVPEGWHACLTQGTGVPMWGKLAGETKNGQMLHTFGYVGVPDTYRILIVTAEGESWISEAYTRTALQSSVTVNWRDKSVTVPSHGRAYTVEFLFTLLPTLAIEALVLLLFRLGNKRNWALFLAGNLITQLLVLLTLGRTAVLQGVGIGYYFLYVIVEAAVLAAELLLYRRLLTGCTKKRATAYAVTANLCSAAAGWFLAFPLWRWAVSLL